jgi:hypothetical protein
MKICKERGRCKFTKRGEDANLQRERGGAEEALFFVKI